ncbi:hypothetical protein IEQ34_009028 [Dendrobium chrysotoxum]|uniref:indole-3-pyruvate monooxygenase n=1 Tax=Dendrobium chrysotoxum TaxID=161865 RepID=A0AAV7H1N5_DENCH|nr:hypothetical protein IEQ34_009028 [Dendrobium chrysotoxum]
MSSTFNTNHLFKRRNIFVSGPIIIGAGPSGLAVAACLKYRNVPFLLLDRANRLASLWQNHTYDRLKLHLPKQFCHLPNFPFPKNFPQYPTKNQFINYLELYAKVFQIKPQFNEAVISAIYDDKYGMWRVRSEKAEYICEWLVVATGENAECVVPEIEGLPEFSGEVKHASSYKSGEVYKGKKVVVVGCGNSGMEICLDLCLHGACPYMVVRDSVHVLPREILGKSTFEMAIIMMKWLPVKLVDRIILTLAWLVLGNVEKYGLKRPNIGPFELKNTKGKTPVLDTGTLKKIKSNEIKVIPGIKRFGHGEVELVCGDQLNVDAVILATGYRSTVSSWLQETGGKSTDAPKGWKGENGLYFVGFSRRGLSGASLDAIRTAEDIGKIWREGRNQTKKFKPFHIRCNPQL